ncbi:MAG: AI-2E family transporter [Bacteroidales bacterium]|nr:AI-2E family transporter [Bacteroidales bacterium]
MGNSKSLNSKNSIALNLAILIIIIAGVMYAQSLITQLLMAFFISIICAQPIAWLQKKKVPQGFAITIVFILIIVVFMGFGELIGTSLSSFSEDAAIYEQNLRDMGKTVFQFVEDKGVKISIDEMTELFDPSKVMGLTAGLLGQLGGFMGNALTIFFLVLFLLMELDSFPIKTRAIIKGSGGSLAFLDTIGNSIRHYLSIKTFTSLLTGTLIWISLAIIGVDYAIIWALIAFLLNYIPNIGSIIAAIPAVLFTLVQLGFGGAIWTTGVFVAVNMLIGNIVEPKMMGKGMGLSTFIVFLSLIFWGFVLGTVGMFLSVPLTMSIKIMLEQKPGTEWMAILLGTQGEAQAILDKDKETIDKS